MSECSVQCGREAIADGLCAHCGSDWRDSDERETADHVAATMLEAFVAKQRAKALRVRLTLARGSCDACGSISYDAAGRCRGCVEEVRQ